jgi:hypothetical protein
MPSPHEAANPESDFVCLKSWLRLPEIAVIHSLLDGSGIRYYIENENAFRIDAGGLSVGTDGLTRLMVDARQVAQARKLLAGGLAT